MTRVRSLINSARGSAGGAHRPEEFDQFIRIHTAKWAKVIKAAGIKVDEDYVTAGHSGVSRFRNGL